MGSKEMLKRFYVLGSMLRNLIPFRIMKLFKNDSHFPFIPYEPIPFSLLIELE